MTKSTNNCKAYNWLYKKRIVLEEAFVPALRNYAKCYKEKYVIKHLDEVYRSIGTNKSHISYWEKHPHSTQTKNFQI